MTEYLNIKNLKELKHTAVLGTKIVPIKAPGVDKDGNFFEWDIAKNFEVNKWTVIVFYPADFTTVCPTEIKEFSKLAPEFEKLNTEVLVASVDGPFTHFNWRNTSLGKIDISMISDQTNILSKYFGIYSDEKGISWRGTFIISPEGILYASYSTFGEVGRSSHEVMRLLQASQEAVKGAKLPCNWQPEK